MTDSAVRPPAPVVVPVGEDYDVHLGHGTIGLVPELVGARADQVLLVHPPTLAPLADAVAADLTAAGRRPVLARVPDAEAAKTAATAVELWDLLGDKGFTRSDVVVGIGGGTSTDLAGFVAASWLRGVAWVAVPTSVAGMVDAAVGGKTGINTRAGKNLVGAFHPPAGVLCDLDTLASLPAAHVRAGLAEVVKCGFIADPQILRLIEADPQAALDVDGSVFAELVERAVRVKARVVAADLRESSLREVLNYGHTFGHAVEKVEGFTWRHGDAVAVGMVYVAQLAHRAGLIDEDLLDRHISVLASLGLPTSYGGGSASGFEPLLAAMRQDKKSRGALLRFVVLAGLGEPTRLEGPGEPLLLRAYEALRA